VRRFLSNYFDLLFERYVRMLTYSILAYAYDAYPRAMLVTKTAAMRSKVPVRLEES